MNTVCQPALVPSHMGGPMRETTRRVAVTAAMTMLAMAGYGCEGEAESGGGGPVIVVEFDGGAGGSGRAEVPGQTPDEVPDPGTPEPTPTPDPEPPPEPTGSEVGAPCERDFDCDTICASSEQGDYCTRSCEEQACPEGFICSNLLRERGERQCQRSEGVFDATPGDGGTVQLLAAGVGLRWSLDYAVDRYDLYLGEGADPPLLAADIEPAPSTLPALAQYTVPAEMLRVGRTYRWQVVAHVGDEEIVSPVWRFETRAPLLYQGACPDQRWLNIDGRRYDTVQIGDDCWINRNLMIGEDAVDGVFSLDDGIVQRGCPERGAHAGCSLEGYYTWWEAHNQYPDPLEPNLVGRSICPDGWEIPSRAQWATFMRAAGEVSIGVAADNLGLSATSGFLSARSRDYDRCDDPNGPDRVTCTRFEGSQSYTRGGWFWTSDAGDTEIRYISIELNEARDGYAHRFGTNTPHFGYSLRCVRAD